MVVGLVPVKIISGWEQKGRREKSTDTEKRGPPTQYRERES